MIDKIKYPFTVALSKDSNKCGCVIVQTLYGATIDPMITQLLRFGDWELDVSKCKKYKIESKEELELIINRLKKHNYE